MRTRLVAGNWKMNTLADEAIGLAKAIAKSAKAFGKTEVLLCPPFVWLKQVAETIKGSPIRLGAQNMIWEDAGAFTGEISAPMLKSAGCQYVIIGHSERRQFFGETDLTVNMKLHKAIKTGLTPIICLGESLQEREAGQTERVVSTQFANGFKDFGQFERVVIAYEPVWAIGTGKTATASQAQEIHQLLRRLLQEKTAEYAQIRILYGGSVKPDNAAELIGQEDVDGFLVGGASLKAKDFIEIVKATVI